MLIGALPAHPAFLLWPVLSLVGLGLCALAATGTQLQTVADRAWPLLAGRLELPAGVVMWALPVLLALSSAFAAWSGRTTAVWLRGFASACVLLGLLALWLVCLARHDRAMTALHAGCVALALCAFIPGWWSRLLLAACCSPVLALVSYGAIWGETRCDEPEGMRCLVTDGPRRWMPALLQQAGVVVFVDLRGADLRGVNWQRRDLRLADLRGARLDGATLAGSNLRRARLDGIHASDSNWQGVFMNGASMTKSTLLRANLSGLQAYLVDLRGSDLSQSDLRDASLSHTRLDGVAFGSARLQGTYLRFSTGLARHQLQQVSFDTATRWPDDLGL